MSRPDWYCLHLHALAHLPRVLAGMGFTRQVGPLPWGGTPLYRRDRLLRYRTLRPGYVSPWRDRDRAEIAASNRAIMTDPVRLALPRGIYVAEITGEWSDETGGARGESLIELGAMMWSCRFGQAGFRIARLCGLGEVPHAA